MIKGNDYSIRTVCRICKSKDLVLFFDMGWMPLAGDYLLKSNLGKEKYYPIKIYFCKTCSLVQVLHVINPEVLFKDYRYLSSIGLSEHFEEYAKLLDKKYLKKDFFIVEIGSNDGVLLTPLIKMKYRVLGVDPARNVVKIAINKGVDTEIAYFGKKVAKKIVSEKGKANAILANNVLAHVDNLDEIFTGINILLRNDGIFVFEVHYLPKLIKNNQYDFFYNEHLSYYSLTSLSLLLVKHEFVAIDVELIPTHFGSIRVFARRINHKSLKVKNSVKKLLLYEQRLGVMNLNYVNKFARKVYENRQHINKLLGKIKSEGKKIVGYGASGRGNVLLNFCDLDKEVIEYIVDESPERQNRFTPGGHIPIVKPDVFRRDEVDYTLLLAWSYQDQIFKKEEKYIRKGGKFIIPLPKVIVYP